MQSGAARQQREPNAGRQRSKLKGEAVRTRLAKIAIAAAGLVRVGHRKTRGADCAEGGRTAVAGAEQKPQSGLATFRLGLAGVVGLVAVGLVGCGAAGGPAPASTTSRVDTAVSAGTSTPTATQTGAEKLITVPDVSGMNHQQAQDTMQAAGLYNLREVDGKGLGRALVVDRNWVQVAQDPPAGTRVPGDAVITLTAVKYTDR
ncbi:PASTA domain-containing protein [Amycolatopsis sp.]|uniref:PASTA domain-containing protein n=1 Tax=Amycolatopsis sp. TaxID=37632 RepID=UPI002C5A19FE|nr:PASTA domain-containing protein [Amycolatopsis sp.]HVV11147.1 PASTA domain-containing protein [Amycolatopsis sp.]